MTTSRWLRVAAAVGPYVACAVVLWRHRWWEVQMTAFVRSAQRVMDAASADLADKATELHGEAVAHGARKN